MLVSSDPLGNNDVKAFIYSWIDPVSKETQKTAANQIQARVIAHFDFLRQAGGHNSSQSIKRLTFNPKDNNQVVTSGNGHFKLWRL
jgi:hypothetical protein